MAAMWMGSNEHTMNSIQEEPHFLSLFRHQGCHGTVFMTTISLREDQWRKGGKSTSETEAVLLECISDHEKHMKDVGVLDQTVVTWSVSASLAEKLEEALLLLLLLGCQIQQCICCRKVFWRKNTYSQVQVWLQRVTRGPGVGTCCPSDSMEFLRGQHWSMTVRKVSPKQRACRECVCCQLVVMANRASVTVCGCRQC